MEGECELMDGHSVLAAGQLERVQWLGDAIALVNSLNKYSPLQLISS